MTRETLYVLTYLLKRPGAEFGGDGKNFRGPRFLNDVFSGKNGPFSSPKFLMTFFSHRPGFSDFALFTVIECHIRPFLHRKNHYFRKE